MNRYFKGTSDDEDDPNPFGTLGKEDDPKKRDDSLKSYKKVRRVRVFLYSSVEDVL